MLEIGENSRTNPAVIFSLMFLICFSGLAALPSDHSLKDSSAQGFPLIFGTAASVNIYYRDMTVSVNLTDTVNFSFSGTFQAQATDLNNVSAPVLKYSSYLEIPPNGTNDVGVSMQIPPICPNYSITMQFFSSNGSALSSMYKTKVAPCYLQSSTLILNSPFSIGYIDNGMGIIANFKNNLNYSFTGVVYAIYYNANGQTVEVGVTEATFYPGKTTVAVVLAPDTYGLYNVTVFAWLVAWPGYAVPFSQPYHIQLDV